MEIQKSIRRRVNVSLSVKGVYTFEATIEIENGTQEELLVESDALVKELKLRYPIIVEVK